jgi:hypothetical protein
MDQTCIDWWMDAGNRWHRGDPPSSWWQADDGRWRPPEDGDWHFAEADDDNPPGDGTWYPEDDEYAPEDDDEATVALAPTLGAEGARLPHSARSSVFPMSRMRWSVLGAIVSAVVLAVTVVAFAGGADRGGDDDDPAAATDEATGEPGPGDASAPARAQPPPTVGDPAGTKTTATGVAPDAESPSERPVTTTTAIPGTPAPDPAPTTTAPPAPEIQQGAECSPEGATAVNSEGVPMLCTAEKCHGASFNSPRWRRASC